MDYGSDGTRSLKSIKLVVSLSLETLDRNSFDKPIQAQGYEVTLVGLDEVLQVRG
jgi:hypothetical protein